jgi:hypothetical protein
MSITSERTRATAPLLIAAAVFTAAGGYLHLREWLDSYREVPASAPGSFVVRIGFPVNAGLSLVLAAALIWCAIRAARRTPLVVAGALLFQAASLITLILTRTGSVFGWSEPIWTSGANQIRAVEIGALVAMSAAVAVMALARPDRSNPTTAEALAYE